MAGLLGDSWDDPRSSANMALAAGLLQGNFGAGLVGANQAYAAQKNDALKAQLLKAQMDNYASEVETRKAALAKQQQIMSLLTGSGAPAPANYQTGQLGSGSFGAVSPAPGVPAIGSPAPAAPASGGSRVGSLSPDQLAMLKASGLDLMDVYKAANEGFERKPGSFYDIPGKGREYVGDPTKGLTYQNGRVGLMPGFTDAQSAITMATELPKAQVAANNDLVKVTAPDGSERYVTRAQAVQSAQPPRPVAPQPSGAPMGNYVGDPQVVLAAINDIKDPAERARAKQAYEQQYGPLQASPTNAQKLSFEAGGKINDSWLKNSYEPTIATGQTARDLADTVQVTRQALRNMGGTGWGTPAKAAAASVLNGLGIAPENAKLFAANSEVFQSKAMERLWATLNEAKGPQTEGDADRAKKTFASLGGTTQANEFILDMAEAKAQRDQMKARFYQEALPIARGKGDLSEVDREWAKRSPSIFTMPTMQRWSQGVK